MFDILPTLLMYCTLLAPLAKFLKLDFASNFFLVLAGPIIGSFANGTIKLD